jgi:hypothetical protein
MAVKRTVAMGLVSIAAVTGVSGCATRQPTTVPAATVPIAVPSASPTTIVVPPAGTPTRVAYPEGAYELRGDGYRTAYYWVWVPAGTQAPLLPPPPPLPPVR